MSLPNGQPDGQSDARPGERPGLLRTHGWRMAYFAAGILFLGLSRFFVPFWVRWLVLIAWAIGLVFVFIRVMEDTDKSGDRDRSGD